MDISFFNTVDTHGEGAELQLLGPDYQKTDCYLTVIGVDSKAMATIKKDASKAVVDKKYDSLQEALSSPEYAARMVLDWRGMESDGKELAFDKELLIGFLDKAPHIRAQIAVFAANRANFIKG